PPSEEEEILRLVALVRGQFDGPEGGLHAVDGLLRGPPLLPQQPGDLADEALGSLGQCLRGQHFLLAEGAADGPPEALTGDASATVAAEGAILGRVGVIAVEARGGEVLQQMHFDEHERGSFQASGAAGAAWVSVISSRRSAQKSRAHLRCTYRDSWSQPRTS